jgi:hypothetical protein
MSLKAFHIFFVTVSVLMAFGFAVWCFVNFADRRQPLDLLWGALSIGAGVGLIFYGKYVLRRLKHFPYL